MAIEEGFVGFDCATCGASMTFDSAAQGLRCAFCGSVTLERQAAPTGRIRAEQIIPFEVSKQAAASRFDEWIGKGFFRPFGVRQAAQVVAMQAVYVPCWCFRARAHTYYAADSSRTPFGARAGWCPVFGERAGHHEGVLVVASGSLVQSEIASIEPYDLARGVPYDRDAVRENIVEDYGVSRREARGRVQALMVDRERNLAAREVPGSSRNVRVNTLLTDLKSSPVLVPVWINAYRYKNQTYRFLINGQSGRLTGRAPFSSLKLALLLLALLGVALLAGLILGGLR